MPTTAARGDSADVSRPSAPPFVSPVHEDVNVIGAIVSRENAKARIKAVRYTTMKIFEIIQWNNQLLLNRGSLNITMEQSTRSMNRVINYRMERTHGLLMYMSLILRSCNRNTSK